MSGHEDLQTSSSLLTLNLSCFYHLHISSLFEVPFWGEAYCSIDELCQALPSSGLGLDILGSAESVTICSFICFVVFTFLLLLTPLLVSLFLSIYIFLNKELFVTLVVEEGVLVRRVWW